MRQIRQFAGVWTRVGPNLLPFADAATAELPLPRLLRLSLFQVSVGVAVVLLSGTLNRVLIVEMGVSSALVALMVALPLLFAPARALIGHRSDTHRSVLGWKRVPYIWFGTLMQFGGLAIMPFALIILSGDTHGPLWVGHVSAALAFLLVGAGLHTTQTAGLALANDLAPVEARPRVVALLYVMLLVGMTLASIVFGFVLRDFSQVRLIQVIQGAALLTMVLNLVALWRQEARDPAGTGPDVERPPFKETWAAFMAGGRSTRLLVAVGLGTAAFSMQDILLEPYGGEILGLGVAGTTVLTALSATGGLIGFTLAARALHRGFNPCRIAGYGALIGLFAFAAVIFAAPLQSANLFRAGSVLIGLGAGLYSVGTLTAAMALADGASAGSGLALGAWGAVQATAAGLAVAMGGALRDGVGVLAMNGYLGPTLVNPATGYSVVYHFEILLLFMTLVAIGPLTGPMRALQTRKLGLAEMPA